MNWHKITEEAVLDKLKEESKQHKILIFKHSTRCPISATALSRLERSWQDQAMSDIKPYFLDLISYRTISNKIAEVFGVKHESPQVIVLDQGKVVYHESHLNIQYDAIQSLVS